MSTIDPEFQNDQDLWGSDQDLWDASIVYEKATSSTLYASGEYLILGNSKPYLNVQNPKGVIEHIQDSGSGTIFKKEFRYSVDSSSFSEFQELTTEALQALGPFQWVWFQFRYILLSGGPATISKVELDFVPIAVNKFDGYVAPAIQDESRVYAFPVTYKSNFLWEPYKMNRAIRLYKDLNLMVNNLFGHETTYYRALPYGRSKDVTLMEYSLYEHDDGKCVKLVVPNNQFPDNKLNMGPFGVDFELPFEVEIDKDYFQKIFGDGTGPQKRDVVYFPRTNRVYEVSSSYLFRDFMNEPLYFKVSLIKWLPKSNAEPSETLTNLEEYTTSAGKLFNDLIEDEGIQVTNPQQYTVATTIDDPVRSFLSKEQTIINENVLNYYNVISEYHYKMEALAYENKLEVVIDNSLLKKDTTYYARFSPSSVQNDVQYYYSMKKMVYLGDNEYGKSIFRYEAGNSQLESYVNASQVFYPGSLLNLYLGEYAGETEAEVIVSCDVTGYASSYIPKVVKYKAPGTFTSTTDRSFSAWFRNRDASTSKIKIDGSVSFDQYSNEIVIALDKKFLFFVGDSVIVSRTSSSDFYIYGEIISVIDENNIVVKADQNIINYVSSSFPSWTSYTDLQVQKSLPRVFLDSIKDEKGIRIEMRGNRHFIITLNGTQTYFSIPSNTAGLENLKWYAVFVNFSNTFKQLTLNIWRTQWDPSTNLPATTDMKMVYNKTVPMLKGDYSSDDNYYLTPSSMDLTNVRLFNKTAETDKQSLILNQNIVKDAQLAIIIDNALPQSKLPYVGYTR
jgi:hypothetical protein